MELTKTSFGAVIANKIDRATSSGFKRGIYLTRSLSSDPWVVSISFSTNPGLIFCLEKWILISFIETRIEVDAVPSL